MKLGWFGYNKAFERFGDSDRSFRGFGPRDDSGQLSGRKTAKSPQRPFSRRETQPYFCFLQYLTATIIKLKIKKLISTHFRPMDSVFMQLFQAIDVILCRKIRK